MSVNDCLDHYYRCLPAPLQFRTKDASRGSYGYFRFGAHITCFGTYCGPQATQRVSSFLHDSISDLELRDDTIFLPFDPAEVIENLRREKYMDNQANGGLMSGFARMYYLIRPTLSARVRAFLQKQYFRKWQEIAFPRWPVDCSVDNLHENLLRLSLQSGRHESLPFIWFWPKGASSCAIMTHDVETTTGRHLCPMLMDIDDAFGIKASFQIVPEDRYPVGRDFLDSIRQRGFELAIHDLNHDGLLYQNRTQFARRAAQIDAYRAEYAVEGFRAAILYRRQQWYEDLNFSYDMSVPNVAHLDPQRGGCCTVMPYFLGNILELPLTTTQDYTLFRILNEHSLDLWKRQIEIIMEKHGLISCLVHPDYIGNSVERNTYEALLRYLVFLKQEKNVWIATPGEVNRWWRQRSQMRLVESREGWRIEGPGQESARVAHASIINDRVVFTLPSMD